MVKNASTKSRSPVGRPPGFDRDAVVSAAVAAFWSNGFVATTVDQLEAATGLDRSSLYKSFGGKTGLYRSAADAYVAMADEELFATLHNGTEGVADIVAFIDRLATSYRSREPRGCFIVNDMAAVPEHDATIRYFERLTSGFRAALERASTNGQIPPHLVEPDCRFLTAAFVGINLIHRNATDPDAANALLDGVRARVQSWETP